MPRKPTAAQVIEQARKLGVSSEIKAITRSQQRLAELIEGDADWWYDQAKVLMEAESEQVRFWTLQLVMTRLLPEKRETVRRDEGMPMRGGGGRKTVFKIINVNRGTEQARREAIEHRDRRALELSKGADYVEVSDDERKAG